MRGSSFFLLSSLRCLLGFSTLVPLGNMCIMRRGFDGNWNGVCGMRWEECRGFIVPLIMVFNDAFFGLDGEESALQRGGFTVYIKSYRFGVKLYVLRLI